MLSLAPSAVGVFLFTSRELLSSRVYRRMTQYISKDVLYKYGYGYSILE